MSTQTGTEKFGAYQADGIVSVIVYGKQSCGIVDLDAAELDELIAKLQRVRESME
jgi:hypothetical protein